LDGQTSSRQTWSNGRINGVQIMADNGSSKIMILKMSTKNSSKRDSKKTLNGMRKKNFSNKENKNGKIRKLKKVVNQLK
jgi:hypothetical protein